MTMESDSYVEKVGELDIPYIVRYEAAVLDFSLEIKDSRSVMNFIIHGSPVLIISKGSGSDLLDLLSYTGAIKERAARFYTSEIICGLEHLHALQIVHLDIKLANILLMDSGHVLITDFDRSYDITQRTNPPTSSDFAGTPYYMAPEIARNEAITTKADVWSLGILMAVLVCGLTGLSIATLNRITEMSKKGKIRTYVFAPFSKPLKSFFNACLRYNYKERASISVVKRLRFYKSVNWNRVASGEASPPFYPSRMLKSVTRSKLDVNPYDPLILAAAYGEEIPQVNGSIFKTKARNKDRNLKIDLSNCPEQKVAGTTPLKFDEFLGDFTFVNPCLHINAWNFERMTTTYHRSEGKMKNSSSGRPPFQ
ncbi:RAC-beta serine/threonine-protein kinase [Taenia crassiceps]|uniref:RAC-beta serine/threonine-protein kinase n=1 Tax=Taenia crassiceps TaxID=6207 RepID=A0ABR4Q5V5_9CEST